MKGVVQWEFEEVKFPETKMKNSGVHRNTPFSMGKVFAKLQVDKTTLRWMVLLMVKRDTAKQWKYEKHRVQLLTRWWFQIFFGIFTSICGGFPFRLIFFKWFNHQPVKRGSIILLILEASPDFPKSAKTKDASSKKNVCEGSRYLLGIHGWDLFKTEHYNPYLDLPWKNVCLLVVFFLGVKTHKFSNNWRIQIFHISTWPKGYFSTISKTGSVVLGSVVLCLGLFVCLFACLPVSLFVTYLVCLFFIVVVTYFACSFIRSFLCL